MATINERLIEEIKKLAELIKTLVVEIQKNSELLRDVKSEINLTRISDDKNRKFSEKLICDLIKNQTKTTTKTMTSALDMLKEILAWAMRIGTFVILVGLGIKFGPSILESIMG